MPSSQNWIYGTDSLEYRAEPMNFYQKIISNYALRKRAKTNGNCFTQKVKVKQALSIDQLVDIKEKFIFALFRGV